MALGILGIAGVALYFTWQHKERQIGAARVEARDAKLAQEQAERNLEQVKHDLQVNADAVASLESERGRLAGDLAARPVPAIRLCPAPSSGRGLPSPAGPAGTVSEGAAARRDDPPVPTRDSGRDITAELQLIALVAEQLAAQDRALLKRERGL